MSYKMLLSVLMVWGVSSSAGNASAGPSTTTTQAMRVAVDWLELLRKGDRTGLESLTRSPFLTAGFNLVSGPFRKKCASLGVDRVYRGLRISVPVSGDIVHVLDCLLADETMRDAIPQGKAAWTGRPDYRGVRGRLKPLKRLPPELRSDGDDFSRLSKEKGVAAVEVSADDGSGMKITAAIIVRMDAEKCGVVAFLVHSKFTE